MDVESVKMAKPKLWLEFRKSAELAFAPSGCIGTPPDSNQMLFHFHFRFSLRNIQAIPPRHYIHRLIKTLLSASLHLPSHTSNIPVAYTL